MHNDIYVDQFVMPDLIPAEDGIFDRHPVFSWIPASAGMTERAITYFALYNLKILRKSAFENRKLT